MMTSQEVLAFVESKQLAMIDLRFTDMLGLWLHTSLPAKALSENSFTEGFGFDASSIKGWQAIHASDMLIVPDPRTAFIDPFYELPTLVMICDIVDPISGAAYSRSPRHIAQKSMSYLKSTNIANTCYIGPELEFFIMDSVQYTLKPEHQFYKLNACGAAWNSGRRENGLNLGGKVDFKGGYLSPPPSDTVHDIRAEMAYLMEEAGLTVEYHHHEVATAGQCEIDIKYDHLLAQADNVMKYKYIVKNAAHRRNKVATFMPKPLSGDNGSGMHTHISLWQDEKPLFAGSGYAGLSEMAMHFIGGILKHAPALAAFTNPTLNSYRRIIPGYEAPVNLAYSSRNRSASIRIPMYSPSPKAKRVEVRFPDPMANPYLSFPAIMLAGLDGIMNRTDPGDAMDKNLYDLDPIELADVPHLPGSLGEALNALESDYHFLLAGDTFTEEFIYTWIDIKRKYEIEPEKLKPTPYEFMMYFNH